MVIPAIGLALLLQSAGQGTYPEVVTRSRVNHSRGVDFHALVVPETVYVGQQATYQLGVFLDQDTRQRIRRNPEFQPPETRSLLSYDLRERAGGSLNGNIDGRPYEVHVFRRALFPLTPGRYAIPRARLTYALPQSPSFFSREENFTLSSEAVAFVAIEPPAAGRPADWAGAVGVWTSRARTDTARGRTGEPFVLTLRVEGQGNVTLLPRPPLSIQWASVVNADERVKLDSTPSLLGGFKEFDWLVTPNVAGNQRVPAVRYAFFNPRTRRYEAALSQQFDLRVAEGDAVAVAPAVSDVVQPGQVLAIEPSLGREAPAPVGSYPLVLALVALAPVATLGAWIARRPRRVRPAATPEQRLGAIGDRADADAVRSVRRALIEGLQLRTGLDPSGLTVPGAWTIALRKAGVSATAATAVEALIAEVDVACFADAPQAQPRGAGWAAQAREALSIVDAEACEGRPVRRRSRATAGAVASMLVLLAGAGVLYAAVDTGARDSFALGTTAYSGGDFVRSARHFGDAARSAPRAAAAWANLGTASFLAHDTASAVLGWQRALRLRPLDSGTRQRLGRVRAPQEAGVARVPRLPARIPSWVALAVWVLGWSAATRQSWHRRSARRAVAGTLLLGGAALAGAFELERRLEARDLVVVMDPAALRAFPALGADTRSTPMAGEVASVVGRQGAWVRLRLDGDRDGWIPRERIAALGEAAGQP